MRVKRTLTLALTPLHVHLGGLNISIDFTLTTKFHLDRKLCGVGRGERSQVWCRKRENAAGGKKVNAQRDNKLWLALLTCPAMVSIWIRPREFF